MKIAYLLSVYSEDSVEYFESAIKSVINQKVSENYEIRIYLGIDGDVGLDLSNSIAFHHKNIFKIVKSHQNLGLAGILNLIIKNLDNEDFLFRMDSDDICLQSRTKIQLDFFKKNPDCIAVGSAMREINEVNEIIGFKKAFLSNEINNVAFYRNPFNHPTMALRGDFFNLVGLYDSKLKKSQDYELWLRAISLGYKLENIKEPLLLFRINKDFHSKRNSFQNSKNEFIISFNFIVNYKKYKYLPFIILKLIIRLLPSNFSKIAYKIIRN